MEWRKRDWFKDKYAEVEKFMNYVALSVRNYLLFGIDKWKFVAQKCCYWENRGEATKYGTIEHHLYKKSIILETFKIKQQFIHFIVIKNIDDKTNNSNDIYRAYLSNQNINR